MERATDLHTHDPAGSMSTLNAGGRCLTTVRRNLGPDTTDSPSPNHTACKDRDLRVATYFVAH